MLTRTTRGFALALCLSALAPAMAASTAEQQQMLDQLAQLDELDHQDFLERNAKANTCVQQQSFDCAEKYIAQAKRVAKNAQDKAALQLTRDNLQMEQELVASEARSRREQKEAEEADRIAEERAVRAQELAEEREAERQRTKYAAMAAGLALGGGGQLSPERQAQLMAAIQRDSYSEGSDASNFNSAVQGIREDQSRQAQERENLRAQQRELQQRQQQQQQQARADAQEQSRLQAEARQQARQDQATAAAAASNSASSRPQPQIVQYVPQHVTLPTWREECPAGSSPARNPNGTTVTAGSGAAYCVKDGSSGSGQQVASAQTEQGSDGAGHSGAGSSSGGSSTAPGKKGGTSSTDTGGQKSQWGAVQEEALAICRQSEKSKMWECNGALDNQTLVDEPTVESALARQRCAGGTPTVGGPVIKGQQWQAYQCGHGVGPGDYDVAKRYNMVTPRRSYICKAFSSGRCDIPYTGQDKQ